MRSPSLSLCWSLSGNAVATQVLQPAIELAEEGFPVAPVTAYHWGATSMELKGPGKAAFLTPDGDAPRAGEIQKNPDLGRTFRSVAEHGALEGALPVIWTHCIFVFVRSPQRRLG